VCERHLQDEVFGNLEQLGVVPAGLKQEGEHVEASLRSFPAELNADLCVRRRQQTAERR